LETTYVIMIRLICLYQISRNRRSAHLGHPFLYATVLLLFLLGGGREIIHWVEIEIKADRLSREVQSKDESFSFVHCVLLRGCATMKYLR
jgi:hypothetical protein